MIGKTNAISGVSEPVPKIRTVSGSVISISNALALPAVSLVADIDPVQDLNGYDKPWAGGAGKNLCPPFTKGVSINATTGAIGSSSTSATTGKIPVNFTQNPNYYLSGMLTTLHNFVAAYNSSDQFLGRTAATSNADKQLTASSFTSGTPSGTGDIAYVRITIYEYSSGSGVIDDIDTMTAQLEIGSSASSYEPYENICPITGWTEAKVWRTGKNLIDDSKRYVVNDAIVYIGAESNAYTVALPAGTYTISVDFGGEPYGMYYREANDTANRKLWTTSSDTTEKTFTIEEDGTFRFWVYRSVASGGVDPTKIIHVQIELGSRATAYEPYNGNTYTIQLGQTVYGGTLDVTTGVLTKVPYYDPYNGETLVGPWVSSMDKYVSGNTPTTGAQVVDLGGTGTDVQLTATEVQMLLGNNTLWADSGDSELQYWARR